MTKKTTNRYSHIESFDDIENEKLKLYFYSKYCEKKLQLKYIELGMLLSPTRLIPILVSEWLNPVITLIKNFIGQIFHRQQDKNASEKGE